MLAMVTFASQTRSSLRTFPSTTWYKRTLLRTAVSSIASIIAAGTISNAELLGAKIVKGPFPSDLPIVSQTDSNPDVVHASSIKLQSVSNPDVEHAISAAKRIKGELTN